MGLCGFYIFYLKHPLRAGDEFGGALNSIKSSNPTFKSHDFIRYFDSIEFCNGGVDNGSPLADALSVALVSMQNKILSINKHILLITNTDYYDTPVQLHNDFHNQKISDLMLIIKQENINFSIIAPR